MLGRENVNVETHNLLLSIFHARYKVNGLHVSDVDFIPQDVGEDDLGYIPSSPRQVNTWRSNENVSPHFFF